MYFEAPIQDPILIISRKKVTGFGDHWGVRFPNGQVVDIVNDPGIRIHSNEEDFAQGHDVTTIRAVPVHLNREVMRRLREALTEQKSYHATKWNCEMFANWLTCEEPESPQVKGWLFLVAAAVVVKVLNS